MKRLIYAGLTALTMLFAMMGFAKAQNTHTVTFNPVQGSIVKTGTSILVSVSPATADSNVSFKLFATTETAEAATPDATWIRLRTGTPQVSPTACVLAVAIKTEGNAYELFYASYTVKDEKDMPHLEFPELSKDESGQYQYGRYTPFRAEVSYEGKKLKEFELYYGLERAVAPKKENYNPANDPLISDVDPEDAPGAIRKAVATNGYAEIMIENGMAASFKAVAYFKLEDSELEDQSDLFQGKLEAIPVESPSWSIGNDRWSRGGKEVDVNTVVKLIDGERNGGCEFYYSTDGETAPYKSLYDNGSDKVFKYNDEQGIKITETMIVRAMAFKEVKGIFSGSERISCRFDVKKPTVNVSLDLEADESGNYSWAIGDEAPTFNIDLPEDVTLGTGANDVAIKLYIYDANPLAGWTQIISQNGAALDMSKAIEDNHENAWYLELSLVKLNIGVDTTEINTLSVKPSMMTLNIIKKGEKPAKPVASIPSGTVPVGTKVTLSCATDSATILYTLGPEEPNVVYNEGYEFVVNQDMSIRTMARKDGIASDLAVYTYKIPIPPLTVEATVDPAPGEIPAGTEITITLSETQIANDRLVYNLYRTVQEADSDLSFNTFNFIYPSEGKPVPTVETPVLRVGVYKVTPRRWKYFNFEYIIMKDIPMPVINPQGGLVKKGTEVEISLVEGAEGTKIYYTLDGSEPTKESTEYTQKIAINDELTLKAIAIKATDDKDLVSNIAEAEFTLYPVAPVITPESCALDSGSTVRIFKGKADTLVVIVGSDFAPTITKHTDSMATVTIVRETLLRAYVIKGELHSDTVRMIYTINPNVANEYKELAGVSVYPNPTDGEINIKLPVNAVVEVFTTNGQMVKRVQMNAGANALRLENSGIYFVRFTAANGQVAIKKVMVR